MMDALGPVTDAQMRRYLLNGHDDVPHQQGDYADGCARCSELQRETDAFMAGFRAGWAAEFREEGGDDA